MIPFTADRASKSEFKEPSLDCDAGQEGLGLAWLWVFAPWTTSLTLLVGMECVDARRPCNNDILSPLQACILKGEKGV